MLETKIASSVSSQDAPLVFGGEMMRELQQISSYSRFITTNISSLAF
jgi:hypothetical protein